MCILYVDKSYNTNEDFKRNTILKLPENDKIQLDNNN